MFRGDRIDVTTFTVQQRLSSKRVRLVADVNGVEAFVKTFGDPIVQCTADELKRLVGLTPLGLSWATIPDYGAVVLAPFLGARGEGHLRFNDIDPSAPGRVPGQASPGFFLAPNVLEILWFDVWTRNNDRTGTNILYETVSPSGEHAEPVNLRSHAYRVIPIDESAAFKRESTFRMTPKKPWFEALQRYCESTTGTPVSAWRPMVWPPAPAQVTETVKRCDPGGWASLSWVLTERIPQMPIYWQAFWKDAAVRVTK